MRFLLVHNHYQQRGGEDAVFEDEVGLLESHGHEVVRYTVHNDVLRDTSGLTAAAKTVWNREIYRDLRGVIRRNRPAVMHCTNTFPLLSPSVYYAAKREGVAVVQSLHNYRLLCPNAQFLRDGKVCEDCLNKLVPWPAIQHGCYRESRSATGALVTMLVTHRLLGTYRKVVDRYIALTDFSRQKFIEAGFAPDRIVVKPNFIASDLGAGAGSGGYAVFVGRLSPEKGIEVLLEAWATNPALPPLRIVGDGPLADRVRNALSDSRIQWLGALPGEAVQRVVADASMLVFPSIWYEGLPKVIVESFCRGTPVVASRLGSMAELIVPGQTGSHFTPGCSQSLAQAVLELASEPSRLQAMRESTRNEFLEKYTAQQNYQLLMSIYRGVLPASPEHQNQPRRPEAHKPELPVLETIS